MSEVDDPLAVNPYAAPTAQLQPAPASQSAARGAFYAMSPAKAAVMSVLTVSIYDLCFWWRHWSTRRQQGDDVNVFGRTIFAVFFSFSFKSRVRVALAERALPGHPLLGAAPAIYLLTYLVDTLVSKMSDVGAALFVLTVSMSALRGVTLAVIQGSVNQVLKADGYRGPVNRGATARTYLVAAAGLMFWALTLLGTFFGDGK